MDARLNQILLASWRQRDPAMDWLGWLAYALMFLGILLSLFLAPQQWAAILASSVCLLLCISWAKLASSLLRQNHPHAARFVPGHVRLLRQTALGAWLGLSLLIAAVGSASMAWMPPFTAGLLFVAAGGVYIAWALRNWMLWFVLWIGPSLFGGLGLGRRLAPLWAALRELWASQPLPVTALCLVAMGWSITRLFGDGDSAHREKYACRSRMRRASQGGMTGKRGDVALFGRPGEWLAKPFDTAAAAWLRHTLARARPALSSIMSRGAIVLHGQQHWLRQAMGICVALCITVLGFGLAYLMGGLTPHTAWKHGAFGIAIGLASMGFNPSFALPNMLWHSRREQALVRLLPGMPQGVALNRAVGWLQLQHALIAWGITSVALTVLAWTAGDLGLLCLAFAALPLCALCLLRAPARMRQPSAWTAVWPIIAFMLLGWGMYLVHVKLHVALALLGGASLLTSLALGAWRWRALVAAPVALPAGRLS